MPSVVPFSPKTQAADDGRQVFAVRDALRLVPLNRRDYQVLRCLADYEHPARGCWPSRDTIAKSERLTVRTVAASLRALENSHLILREACSRSVRNELGASCHGERGGNHYHLNYSELIGLLPPNAYRRLVQALKRASSRQPVRVRQKFDALALSDAIDRCGDVADVQFVRSRGETVSS